MKIVDNTPFLNEKGEISLVDRVKAMLKNGKGWMDEVDAQKSVIPVLDKSLDKSYTLLRNITLPDVAATIPFILVGPPGIFVIYVTNIVGMFRAKGDQWGTVDDNAFKLLKPNLLTRTETMARTVQVYLQRHGYNELTQVEPILLCSDPRVHVDSLRPIVRVVMRDALERLALSISQARPVYTPEAVFKLVNLFINLPQSRAGASAEESPAGDAVDQPADSAIQAPPPAAIQLPGDELFPRSGPPPRIERSAWVEQPVKVEKTPPMEGPPSVEQALKPEVILPAEPLPRIELPAREPINPWEEQPPQEKSTLPAGKPASDLQFAWEEELPQDEEALSAEKPAAEPLFPWEEPSPQEGEALPAEKPAAEPLFPWKEPPPLDKQATSAEIPVTEPPSHWKEPPPLDKQALSSEKPAKEPLFPWNEPAPKVDQPVKEERFPWTEEYPQEMQRQVNTWLPQSDQTSEGFQPPADIQSPSAKPAAPRGKGFSRKQWIFLAGMLFIWFVLVVIFIIKVVSDLIQ